MMLMRSDRDTSACQGHMERREGRAIREGTPPPEERVEDRPPERPIATSLEIERLVPVLHNVSTGGRGWRECGITTDRVPARNAGIARGSRALWDCARSLVERAVARGDLAPAPDY
jgi:hypothetical protein